MKKQPIFSKELLETYLGRIFDYEANKNGTVEFKTEYGYDDFFLVIVGKDFVEVPNESSGGGYIVDEQSKPGFKVNDIDVLVEALDNFNSEEYGWECF